MNIVPIRPPPPALTDDQGGDLQCMMQDLLRLQQSQSLHLARLFFSLGERFRQSDLPQLAAEADAYARACLQSASALAEVPSGLTPNFGALAVEVLQKVTHDD